MGYLILNDYYSQIQINNLNQLIGNDLTKLTSAANKAEAQCISYLVQKYDISGEFTDTNPFVWSTIYHAGDRIYITAEPYLESTNYGLYHQVLQAGNIYICTTGGATGPFDASFWTLLGPENTLFYAKYPQRIFNYQAFYNVDDQVFWKNNVYQCKIKTSVPGHDTQLQYGLIQNAPFYNVFPDDPINGVIYWGAPVPYAVSQTAFPIDIVYWIEGDNRSQELLEVFIDVALYKIHKRIAPRNIPDLRVKAYDDGIQWLRDAKDGEVTASLPMIQPSQGRRIRYGGNVKNINSY